MPCSVIYEFAQKRFITTLHSTDQLNDKHTKNHCLLGNNLDSMHTMTNQLIKNILVRVSITFLKRWLPLQEKKEKKEMGILHGCDSNVLLLSP